MGMGKRKPMQEMLFVSYNDLPRSAGHPFYVKLNELLQEAGFDAWLEKRCQPVLRSGRKTRPAEHPTRCLFSHVVGRLFRGH